MVTTSVACFLKQHPLFFGPHVEQIRIDFLLQVGGTKGHHLCSEASACIRGHLGGIWESSGGHLGGIWQHRGPREVKEVSGQIPSLKHKKTALFAEQQLVKVQKRMRVLPVLKTASLGCDTVAPFSKKR